MNNAALKVVAMPPLANQAQRLVDEMNEKFAVISVGNKIRILHEFRDPVTRQASFDLLPVQDFLTLMKNKPAPGTEDSSAGQFWLNHPLRRYYLKMDFYPGDTPPGVYNLWRGFGIAPRQGACGRFWTFLHEVICSGNDEHYCYVRRWISHMIRRPRELPEVALVLRGLQGTGKSTFAHILGHLVEPHYIELSGMHQVSGKFNSHLANVLLVNANEAIWGGHKSEEGALKAMITDPTTAIEGKGRDIIQVRNFKRLIVTTNEAWAVPMAADDRRFFVLDVSDARKEDHAYFAAIAQELESGGYEALMHDLMHESLEGFNPRQVPATGASFDLKLRSADLVTQWLYELLNAGYHDFASYPPPRVFGGALVDAPKSTEVEKVNSSGVTVETERLHDSYLSWCSVGRQARPETRPQFIKRLKQLLPSMQETRPTTSRGRLRGYALPPLQDARTKFEANFKLPGAVQWEEPKAGKDAP